MNAAFWFTAGVLTGATLTAVSLPLWRGASGAVFQGPRRVYAMAAAGLVVFSTSVALLYLAIGSPAALDRSAAPAPPHPLASDAASGKPLSMEAATAGLEARLERNSGKPEDWELLGKSYDFLGRSADAARVRQRATATPAKPDGATSALLAEAELHRSKRDMAAARETYEKLIAGNGMTAQAWADYADVVGSLAQGSLDGAAGRAIDSALALDPMNSKALWLDATRALQQQRYDDALRAWRRLRSALPPDSADTRIIDANIEEAQQLALRQPAATAAGDDASTAGISGTVSIDSGLATQVDRGATLFIYAKAADSPGAPLAVLRLSTGTWPVSFRLDDTMAMVPSRRLSQFRKVIVEARISRSGQATPASGDLFVTSAAVSPGSAGKLSLVINHQIG